MIFSIKSDIGIKPHLKFPLRPFPAKTNFRFVEKWPVVVFIALITVFFTIFGIMSRSMNWGIDFAGGILVEFSVKNDNSNNINKKNNSINENNNIGTKTKSSSEENDKLLFKLREWLAKKYDSVSVYERGVKFAKSNSDDRGNGECNNNGNGECNTIDSAENDVANGITDDITNNTANTEANNIHSNNNNIDIAVFAIRFIPRTHTTKLVEVNDHKDTLDSYIEENNNKNDDNNSLKHHQQNNKQNQEMSINPNQEISTVEAILRSMFGNKLISIDKADYVGPKVEADFIRISTIAVVSAIIAIMTYVAFRFEWRSAVGVVAALTHDIVAMLCFYTWTRYEFDLTSIAALLTVTGYSVNDSVVIYDRIRVKTKKFPTMSIKDLVNVSLNETLSRTIMTVTTTLLVCASLFFWGGRTLHEFSAAIFFGIVVGTYSSLYVSGPILVLLDMKYQRVVHKKHQP